MIELPLIFLGGVLGSAHCVGMCGPLALSLSASTPPGQSLLARQVFFSVGRLFTYSFCGAFVGLGGAWLSSRSSGFVLSQAWLALLAGIVLIVMGLITANVFPKPMTRLLSGIPCGAITWLKTFLAAPGWSGPLLAGVFTGFIPCGLVYAFLLKASSAGGIWQGWLTMAVFGSGTIPLMLLLGYGGKLLSLSGRARLFQIAAWCIVLTGVISIARGAAQLGTNTPEASPTCPLCAIEDADTNEQAVPDR